MTEETGKEKISKKFGEDDNIIFIGAKPFMNYVTGVMMQFSRGKKEVLIRARGKFMSRAIDVAEVVKKRPIENRKIEIQNIKTNSEEFENKEGKKINVSTIEISLVSKE